MGLGELGSVVGGAAAEQRKHATVPGYLARFLHQPASQRDQLEAVALLQRASRDERGELPAASVRP